MSNLVRKMFGEGWEVVTLRSKNGIVIQRDVTSGLDLLDAVDSLGNLRSVYQQDGFVTVADGQRDPKSGEVVAVYLDCAAGT